MCDDQNVDLAESDAGGCDAGFEYRGQRVFKNTFGGKEVVTILEPSNNAPARPKYEYRLLATKKTTTLQKELGEAGERRFNFVGLTVAETLVAGNEVVDVRLQPGAGNWELETGNWELETDVQLYTPHAPTCAARVMKALIAK